MAAASPEPTWIDRLLSDAEQHRIVRVLHDAGNRNENMRMLVHEMLILTVAGVAWFLVSPKR